jgi:transposase
MAKATKEQIEHAKELAAQGLKPKEVSKKSGVCINTAYYLCSKASEKHPEPPCETRPMNAEEIAKYGPPKPKGVEAPKTEETREPDRQIEITVGPLPIGKISDEIDYVMRSLNYLHVKSAEIIIRSAK